MIDHPNFPPSLSITPNVTEKTALEGDVFGVEAQREAISRYGIAGRVWEAAYLLCAYVEHDALDIDPPFVDDPDEPLGVIELGSGTGVVAALIAGAIQRADRPGGIVIATDLPDVCPLLQRNLGHTSEDASGVVFVRPLAWGHLDHATAIVREFGFDDSPDPRRRLTHIVCSDLVYFPELLGPLLRSLIHLTSPPCVAFSLAQPKVVISYKIRSLAKETPFWTAFGLWFSFWPILARRRTWRKDALLDEASESWRQFGVDEDVDRTTFVFVAHRRPESIAWNVPETDAELMAGVGARSTSTKNADDTFETILFMAMGLDNTGE